MSITVKHPFVSAKSDDVDTTIVRPSNWNDNHTFTMATNKLLGRGTAADGAVEEITLGSNLSFSGTTLNAAPMSDGDKGDITVSSSGTVWTIDANAVTYAKLQLTSAASVLLGCGAASPGNPQEITLGTGLTMTGTTLSAFGTGFSTGDVKLTLKTAADAGWVLMNDGTIGDATSAATTRANADTQDLFVLLWTNISNTWAPVSGGRGGAALSDFNAHKTLTLPKALGRSLAVAGSGSGLTTRALGSVAGAETETPTEAKTASHRHLGVYRSDTPPTFSFQLTSPGSGADTVVYYTDFAGGGSPLNIIDPSTYMNVMIKL